MGRKYERIVILGTGKLFLDCLEMVSHFGIPYEGYEASPNVSRMTLLQAQKKGFPCSALDRDTLFSSLAQEKKETLLISAINPVILPEAVLKNEKILALNCHQALLPRHKGRNAESWAIYEGDMKSGITWHKMTAQVDAGEILLQKTVPVTETTTAYGLFRQQIEAASEGFAEIIPKVLDGSAKYHAQGLYKEEGFHYSWEMPAQGRLDLEWSAEKMSRFLRATDYGILKVMERPTLVLEGEKFMIRKYKIERITNSSQNLTQREENQLTLIRRDYRFILTLKPCSELP